MNKNLKKVISSVAALSMVASSVVAFAAKFPDVEDTASYTQAVQELSALNVINGYEDGTFKPDNLVTRAEITKMIVDALNEGSQAAASKGTQQFTDVAAGESGHWANGYIVQGTTDGWIAGMGDGTFAPDANVTYVQAQKMLVSAIGYDVYAQGKGGWPAGYKMYANSLDITKGVQGVEADEQQLTRAQVAQMIDNAMGAPLCVIEKWETNVWGTGQTPVLDTKDGEGKDFQTLFTDRHDAYKVYGRVTATSADGSMDVDKVSFNVEKADNFEDEYIKATDDPTEIDAYIGDSEADKFLTVYAQALIQVDDDDEYTILSITPAAANKSVELLAEDIDTAKTDLDNNVIYFFPTGQTRGSVKYNLAETVTMYVNGVKQDAAFDADAFAQYIAYTDENGNEQTTNNMITLQKTTAQGSTSTSSKYDTIMITSYTTAVVDQVIDRNDQTQINFKDYNNADRKATLKVEKDNEDKKYTFTLNDEVIDAADLQENDVLTISYNENDNFADSNFYDVKVSRNTAEALKCTSNVNKNNEVTLGGTKYKVVSGMENLSFETSKTYSIYLDVFGRVAAVDEDASLTKIAILSSVYQKSNGDYVAEIITKDGKEVECKVDDEDGAKYKEDYDKVITDTANTDGSKNKKAAYPKLVIDYKLSSANKLTINKFLEPVGGEDLEYKERSSKIDNMRISDATVILDLSDIDSKDTFKVMAKDDLKDGVAYTAYGFDKSKTSSTYGFVVITDGIGGLDSTTQLAIFLEAGEDVEEDGDEVNTMVVVENGEKKTVVLDEDIDDFAADLEEGDLILYVVNNGYVTKAQQVFAANGVLNGAADYEAFRDDVLADMSILADFDFEGELSDADEDQVNVQFGVMLKTNGATVFATEVQGDAATGYYVDLNDAIDIDTGDAKIYTYNFEHNPRNNGRIVLDDGLATTTEVTAAYENGDKGSNIYYLTGDNSSDSVTDSIVFAVVRTFDGDAAQEVYQIVAE